VHKRCSGVKGNLVDASPTFVCRRCRNPRPQVEPVRMESVTVDGDEFESVDSFCYLGDKLDAEGGVDAAVTSRIRSGWTKFRELAPFLTSRAAPLKLKGTVYAACVRTSMVYGSEAWALKAEQTQKLDRAEAQMIRWMSGVTLHDRKSKDELRTSLGLDSITDVVTRSRLRWYGHVERKDEEEWIRRIRNFEVEGRRPPGRPQKSWQELVSADLRRLRLRPSDAEDRDSWRRTIHEATSNLGPPRKRTLNRR